jgi:hypothetical protein
MVHQPQEVRSLCPGLAKLTSSAVQFLGSTSPGGGPDHVSNRDLERRSLTLEKLGR